MTITPERKSITATMFQHMHKHRLFDPDERIELINGELITISPIGPWHTALVNRLTMLLVPQALSQRLVISVQNPLVLNAVNQPQPDLVVLRPWEGELRLPTAADALVVIEVADTTLRWDRQIKLPRYAAAQIPELWIMTWSSSESSNTLTRVRTPIGRYCFMLVELPLRLSLHYSLWW